MAHTNVDVIVIGAGISGLSAAKVLHDQGVKVVVVEARDRVGGRTCTVRDARYGGYTDVGGAYVGQTQRHLVRMAQSLGISIYRIYTAGKSVIDIQGTIFAHDGTVPPIRNPLIILDMNAAIQHIYKLCDQIPIDAPWTAAKAAELDAMTMQQLINKISWTGFTRQTLTIFYTVSLASNPKEVSALYALWYTKNCQGLLRMITTENGGQEYKFVGGSMQISEKLAALLGDRVVLDQPVIRVEQTDKGVTVATANGTTYTGNYVISAMPQALLNRVTFVPSLPPNKIQLFQHMPMGVACKTMIFYKTAMWREQGYSGQTASDSGLITVSLDDTKPDGTAPCLIGFVVGSEGTKFARLSVEERKQQVAQHYAKLFKSDEYLKPVEYIDKLWSAEEYSGGCYVSALPPGALSNLGYAIREPIGRVYFAGTEASTNWSGYMNGAINAGERTARQVLVTLGRLQPDQVEQEEPMPPGFPEVKDAFDFTLCERLMPSVPTFLLLSSAAAITALYFASRSGHLTKLTNGLLDRWQ